MKANDLPPRWRVTCKVCGADLPKKVDYNSISWGWILAISEGAQGNEAIIKALYWCSIECQENDTEYIHKSSLDVLDQITKDIWPADIIKKIRRVRDEPGVRK